MKKGKHIIHIDDRPMEIIPIEERKEKFKREIGPDMDRLTPEQIKKIVHDRLKAFALHLAGWEPFIMPHETFVKIRHR